MKGRYVVRDCGALVEYTNYESIPLAFDHLISFEPEIIPGPHTYDEHQEMNKFNDMLKQLIKRERSNNNASSN
jgi:hypothetical protein